MGKKVTIDLETVTLEQIDELRAEVMSGAREVASKQIADIMKEIRAKQDEAAAIADKYGIEFYFDFPGGGGVYRPAGMPDDDEYYNSDETGWVPSSMSC